MAVIDAALATIQKDGAMIKRHCAASPDEVQAAIRAYQTRYQEAETTMLGAEFMHQMHRTEAKANLRRIRIHGTSAAFDDRISPEIFETIRKEDA